MFKALMGGRSSSDLRSKSSRRKSEKTESDKSDTRSISSRKSSRGDDRDRGLGDISSYSSSRSHRGPHSTTGDSIASFVTAEPEPMDNYDRLPIERTPKRRDSDRESKSTRRRTRDRSESPDRERRRRRATEDSLDDLNRERDRRERSRTHSGDPYMPPISTNMPSSAPGAQFPTEGAGFSQFPMQYDNAMPSAGHSPEHALPYDPHVQHQFPGQFPETVAGPYRPPNPAGAAADYYGDQGQSIEHQPGVRPAPPTVLPNTQAHLMAASPSANPPPEPSSMGQTGAAAAYFDDNYHVPEVNPPASSSRPPKPSNPSKPSKPSAANILPAAALGAAATYGIGNVSSHSETYSSEYDATSYQQHQPMAYNPPVATNQPMPSSSQKPPKPSHSHSFSEGAGLAAAGAAGGYILGHQHHSSSPEHGSYSFQNYEQSSQAGVPPYAAGHSNSLHVAGPGGHATHAIHNPGFYPHGPSALAMRERQRGAVGRFVDFWRDPEGVGRFEDYTETIGVCKYCFQPGTTSVDAPRKHHYHSRRRRHSADRYSSGSSRVSKVSRYNSSEDESRRRNKSNKSSSWLPGMLAGYATKSLFSSKEFDDSYSIRSGRVDSSHGEDDDRKSYTSRGVTRRSGRSPHRDHQSDFKRPHSGYARTHRSRSRSSSRSGRHSFMKEAALGAAVGGAAYAVSKSRNRSRSRSPERSHRRKDSTSSSSFVNVARPAKKSVAGGIGSFFMSSSENRKKRQTKKRRGFFSFNGGSSSSSLDNDLAFGDGFQKKSKLKKKDKKGKDVDAALIGLGATANRLAGSSPHGPGRTTGQMYTAKSRHSNYASSATNDEEWVDESEDGSSASSALAFGASSSESTSDSSSSKWGWRWGSKKSSKKKDKRSNATKVALAAGAGALGAAAISARHHDDSKPPSSAGSLQQVYPIPTSDPSRFDVAKMNPRVQSVDEPTLVRPGPIPLQQPQPFTPVSQSVFTTQGGLPAAIPAYSAPVVPAAYGNGFEQYDRQFQDARDPGWAPEDSTFSDRRRPLRRSDSSPVYPTQETASSIKRRSTGRDRDQASVSFNLTEEQVEREHRNNRREKNSSNRIPDEPVQLIDREEDLARQEAERRDRRRKEKEAEKRREDSDREKSSSSWVGPAAAGVIGAAAASAILSRKGDDNVSEASSRHSERREKRLAERYRYDNEADPSLISEFKPEPSIIFEFTPTEPIEEFTAEHHEDPQPRSPHVRPAYVHDDYAEFYAPEEIRHSPDVHARHGSVPTIVEVEPASERRTQEEPEPVHIDYSYEPYQSVDRLPWPVPRLNFIDPTPPHSVNGGSVRDAASPVVSATVPAATQYDTKPRSTTSRVSWGEHKTHEYEIPSSSEQDPLDYDAPDSPTHVPLPPSEVSVSAKDVPLPASEVSQNKNVGGSGYGADIEFAATIAAATAAAGFDPKIITNDPSYHMRTSPPGSEDEKHVHGPFTSPWSKRRDHGFVEGELEELDPKSKEISPAPERAMRDKDEHGDRVSPERADERNIDTYSMPGGFDTADPRDYVDDRSVFSAPPVDAMSKPKSESKPKSKKSRRSSDVFDVPELAERDIAHEAQLVLSQLPEEKIPESRREELPIEEHRQLPETVDSFSMVSAPVSKDETSKTRSRKSRRGGDDFEIPYQEAEVEPERDESFSVVSAPISKDETSKSKARKSRRSGDDFETAAAYQEPLLPESRDDSFSIISAPVSKDETSKSKSRKSRRSGDDFEVAYQEPEVERDDSFSVISAPISKEETSKSKSRKSRRSGDDFEIYESREPSPSREVSRSATSTPGPREESSKSRKSRRSGDDYESRSREVSLSRDDRSVFSAPVSKDETSKSRRSRRSGDDFDISRSRDVSESRDDTRSVLSESAKSRKSRRSGDDFDPRRDAGTPPPDDEGGEEKRRRRKHRSKSGSDAFSVDDDARSVVTDVADDKSERRKHRHRSSRDFDDAASITSAITDVADDKSERRKHRHRSSRDFDDNASVTSSPARISESRERRKGEEKKDKSGGFLRSLFGSQVSAPAERVRSDHSRDHSRSSSLDKRSSREAISEVGGDEERRRRKKRSSRHRSSSNGDELNADLSDKEKDDPNLEEYRSSRQRKEEERRQKYEDIVDSGRKRDSAKDYNDDANSFLSERPEMPANHDTGASGLLAATTVAAGLGLNEILQGRPRSRSISPPNAEKTLDLTPKSSSRPGSPETSRHSPPQRRHSVAKATESPTAVPLHFRRPPTSPGLSRALPVEQPLASPGSPSQQRHRRPGSVEFRNSREIRPLWLVERHSLVKGETEGEGDLPSLPSSKTSSRAPSIEDLKALNDEDMKSWEHVDLSQSIMDARPNLTISTDQAHEHGHGDRNIDVLDSQQATPTAEHFDKEKDRPRYEFHSPSELLRDPASLDELPASLTMDRLPSVEGSVVGSGSPRELSAEEKSEETNRALDALEGRDRPRTPAQDGFDSAKGGFADVVDAAAIAAVRERDEHEHASDESKAGFGDVVDQAVATETREHRPEDISEPVTAAEDKVPEAESIPEVPKELTPESTEQPVEEPQPSELAADDVEASQSSKKKKKKKGKKNQAQTESEATSENGAKELEPAQDIVADTLAEIAEPAPEPATQSVEASREIQVEPEAMLVERDAPVQPEPEAEPVEASRNIALEPEVVAESPEAMIAPNAEAETAPAEIEQAEDTTSSSKKSKKDKKKKKKGKNASTEEPTEDVVSAQPAEETPTSKEIDEVPISTDIEKTSEELLISDVAVEQDPAEQIPKEELAIVGEDVVSMDHEKPTEEASEPVFIDANESQTPEATPQPEAEEASRGLEDIEKPTEDTAVAFDEPAAVPETPKEGSEGEDEFQEAVEEQSPQPAEEQLAQPAEEKLAAEPAAENTPAPDTPTEATESKAEKRKNKKKKNRKSAVEDNAAETPASEGEPQPKMEEPKLEEPVTADPADTQSPQIGGEALPSDPEAVENINKPSDTAIEELAAPQEQDVPSTEAVDAIFPAEVEFVEDSSRDLPAPAAETQPETDLMAPTDESSREVTEPTMDTQPEAGAEAQPEAEAEAEAEAEPEVAMTAAQKKKAKKDKKKKGKQTESSIPDDEKPAEATEAAPGTEGAIEDIAKEFTVLEDAPVDVPQGGDQALVPAEGEQSFDPEQPSQTDQPAELEIPKEETTLPAEAAAESIEAETPAEPSVSEEQPKAEETPAEPEVPMTAAEKKKAKKNKKKQQKQEESTSSVPDDAQTVEPSPLDAEPIEASKEIAPAEDAQIDAPADALAPVDIEPSGEQDVPPVSTEEPEILPAAEAAPSADAELAESSKDIAPVSEAEIPVAEETSAPVDVKVGTDSSAPVDLPQDIDETSKPDEPREVDETPAPVEGEAPTKEAPTEQEVPMTAAEKKKAKKNKKKQQKSDSVQLDEQPIPEAEPTSTEDKSVEQPSDVVPEAESAPTAEVVEVSAQPEPAQEADIQTKPAEEQTRDLPTLENEAPTEPITEETVVVPEVSEQVLDVPINTKEAAPATGETTALAESAREEQKGDITAGEAPLDKSLDDKPADSTPEGVAEETMTPAQKRKAKKDKKKNRQSAVAEGEQSAPTEEASPATPAEKEIKPAEKEIKPAEEEIKPAEDEPKPASIEQPTEALATQETEQPVSEPHAEPPVAAQDAPRTEEIIPEESIQVASPVDEAAVAAAAEAAEYEGMNAAQRKKAKREKKKREALAAKEQPAPANEETEPAPSEPHLDEQPAPLEEEIKLSDDQPTEKQAIVAEEGKDLSTEEHTEPTSTQEIEQSSFDQDADLHVVGKEKTNTEEASTTEEITQPQAPVESSAAEVDEFEGMTAAQRKKAKKEKKKREALAAEENKPTPVEEEHTAAAEVPLEVTEPSPVQDAEQPSLEPTVEVPTTAEEPKVEEIGPTDETAQLDVEADRAAAEAVEVDEFEGMTAAQKKKAKKEKKKREALAAEENEPTPTSVEEEQPAAAEVPLEVTEPISAQDVEQPSPEHIVDAPATTTEEPKAEELPPTDAAAQPDAGTDAAAAEAAEAAEYEGMTAAQKKKAKKEKKKRQSLAAEEQKPTPSPVEEEQPAAAEVPLEVTEPISAQDVEQPSENSVDVPTTTQEPKTEAVPTAEESSQPDPTADAAVSEATEEAEYEGMTAAQKKKAKKDKKKQQRKSVAFEEATPAEEPKEEQPDEKSKLQDTPAELAVSDELPKELAVTEEVTQPAAEQKDLEKSENIAPTEEAKEIIEAEASDPTEAKEPISAAESTGQSEQDTQLPSEPQSPVSQEPEVPLTAAQKKKAKKNKKKGKSVDLAEETSVPAEASEVPEAATETPTDTPAEIPKQAQPTETVGHSAIESETPNPEDVELAVSGDLPKDEAPTAKEIDNETPAIEAVAEPEPTPKDANETASSPADTTAAEAAEATEAAEYAGMTAAQRKKAKKAKKRQSKNANADNDSAPATEPGTPVGEPNSVEKGLFSTDTDAPGLSAVTASSPAEHDGKDQSHDETHDATAQETPSTDIFMSSQVETPIDSSFLDYPPQPVLERSVNSGELEEVAAPQEGDVAPSAQELDVAEPTSLAEEKAVDNIEVGEEKSSVPEAGDLSMEQAEEKPVDVPVEVVEAQTEEVPLEDEASEMTVSKKQKKKNKKNKNKKQEEEVQVLEPESFAAEEKEQLEAVPLIEAAPQAEETAITEPELVSEAERVTVLEEQPTEQSKDIEEPSTMEESIEKLVVEKPSEDQPIEVAEDTKEPTIPEAEGVNPADEETAVNAEAPITEEPEKAPVSKKKSKKDKKKERQLSAQEPEAEPQAEEQPTPEVTGATALETEIATETAPADEKTQDEPAAQTEKQPTPEVTEATALETEIASESAPAAEKTQDEPAAPAEEASLQPNEIPEETAPDVERPAGEAEQPAPSQEVELGERSLGVPSIETNPGFEDADKSHEDAVETLTQAPDSEQAAEQAPFEAPAEVAEEKPTAPKKLTKKEKKAAAAAAAAAAVALEEEKSAEPEAASIDPSTATPEVPEQVAEQPILDEPLRSETKDEAITEAAQTFDESTEATISELKEDDPEPAETLEPTEPLEPEAQPKESAKELADEPIDDSLTRKMSKKEKKKAKKQGKQIPIEPSSPAPKESTFAAEPDIVEAAPEPLALNETPVEPVPAPESISRETPNEAFELEPETIETAAVEEETITSKDKQIPASENDETLVCRDPIDAPSPAEADVQDTSADIPEQVVTDKPLAPVEDSAVEHHVEQAAEPDAVAEPLGDQTREPEVVPALSKKMSKKDKRKAKKTTGITDEAPTQEEVVPVIAAEQTMEAQTQSANPVMEPESQETGPIPEPGLPLERELPIDAPLPIEEQHTDQSEPQVESQQFKPELLEKEIGTAERMNIAPFEEDSPKAQATKAPVHKPDEEDWPAIDWEQKAEQSQQLKEADLEPEPVALPAQEIVGDFERSPPPKALQDTESKEAAEDSSVLPMSKKDKKKAKKNKKQSQQAFEAEEPEIVDKEIEPPARATTPGGSKIANLFPGLERGGFKRTLEKQDSPKDCAEEADLKTNFESTFPVSEAPAVAIETRGIQEPELPSTLEQQIESAIAHVKSYEEVPATENEFTKGLEQELPTQGERSLDASVSFPTEVTPEEPASQFPPEQAGKEQCELRRSPSIHGRHQITPRTWSLEEPSLAARAPSPPRSLFGGPSEDSFTRPRTPLDTIVEQEPREGHQSTTAQRGTPRLEIKPEHVLPRPHTPVRKFTDNAFDRESWPTDESKKLTREPSRDNFREITEMTKTPEQGFQILKPSTSSGKLRRAKRSVSGDLRAASRDSQPSTSTTDLDLLPSSSSYDPVTDKGKRPVRNMSDVYEGWGETPNSPRSPSRPPSVRRRRSMQHLQDIETRIDQLISENRLLIAARDEAEDKLRNASVARRKSDRALNTRDGDLRDRDAEVEQLKNSVEWLQKETSRLTQENEAITASNAALAAAHAAEVTNVRESSTRELNDLRSQHTQLSSQMEDRVRQEIESALAQKDIELRRLRTELEEARDKVKELQQQISASVHDNALVFRDEEYFDAACQKLCGHVQSWVVRFSKHSDKRRCRPLIELQDEKIADRFDNALLDGSDPDAYLSDRVRRRDVFMSVVMTMVWEYIFTRYLFGMDREQRQKLKSLEKQLGEVGPSRAVHRWRATTLTLLSRRPAFAAQRESDTEAVTLEIFQTLSRVLPPPSHVESQLLDNLRKIMRVAVNLSLEMRTQLAEYIMLPPLQPEYDTNGDLARQVYFNAALMNERSGQTNDNDQLEAEQSVVRIVLFPLVVKKGSDVGEGDDEVVVCPAQVLIARQSKDKVSRMMSGDRMSIDASKSVHSVAPSSMMDNMSTLI